jgi:hypothetical protein
MGSTQVGDAKKAVSKKKERPTCDACHEAIKSPRDGVLVLHDFGNYLRRRYERDDELDIEWESKPTLDERRCASLEVGKDARFIEAVARCYWIQFRRFFYGPTKCMAPGSHIVDNDAAVQNLRNSMDSAYRLRAVLRDYPKRHVCLAVHDDCLPEELQEAGYQIGMTRIATPAQAIEWTIQLSEKTWWNSRGWAIVLLHLFGRNPA